MNLAEVSAKISFSSTTHPELTLRHLTTPVSPPPDSSQPIPGSLSLREPVVVAHTSLTPDFRNASKQRLQIATRSELTRVGKGRLRAYTSAADIHILPPLRNRPSNRQRIQTRELPQIYICPAPKYTRQQQQQRFSQTTQGSFERRRYYRGRLNGGHGSKEGKTVTIPRHLASDSPEGASNRLRENQQQPTEKPELEKDSTKAIDAISLRLKSIDLNKGLEAASAQYGNDANLTIALSRKQVAKRQTVPGTREMQVVSLSHLPLREVYLKPESGSTRELASRQHKDKMIRIMNWLKELNYLNEEDVERGRIEVEKTHFQLPEIKDSTLIV